MKVLKLFIIVEKIKSTTRENMDARPYLNLTNKPETPEARPYIKDPPPSTRPEKIPSLAASVALLCFSALNEK
jgi:hypothetical protein